MKLEEIEKLITAFDPPKNHEELEKQMATVQHVISESIDRMLKLAFKGRNVDFALVFFSPIAAGTLNNVKAPAVVLTQTSSVDREVALEAFRMLLRCDVEQKPPPGAPMH